MQVLQVMLSKEYNSDEFYGKRILITEETKAYTKWFIL